MVFKYKVFTLPMIPSNPLIFGAFPKGKILNSFLKQLAGTFFYSYNFTFMNKTDSLNQIKTTRIAQ